MEKNDYNLIKKQYMTEHFHRKEITSIKELIVGKEKKMKQYISDVQSGIINFCIHINDLQNDNNFFNLKLNSQFKFNECVDKSVKKVEKDFLDIEVYYNKCKRNCYEKFPQAEANVIEFIEEKSKFFRPKLNPCLEDCRIFFDGLHKRYFHYLFKRFSTIFCQNPSA